MCRYLTQLVVEGLLQEQGTAAKQSYMVGAYHPIIV